MRSQSAKEKLLFIAPSVPRYDLNSGDFRLFSILKILSKSHEIIYLAPGKFQKKVRSDDVYISSLKDLGINVLFAQDCSFADILRRTEFKATILEFYFVAEYYLPRIKILQPNCPVIIDTVDVHYSRLYLKYQITKNMGDLKKAEETKKRELDTYKKADIVLTVTDEDAKILEKDSPNLVLRTVPNIHSINLSDNKPDKKSLVFVGGFSHEPNIDAVLYFCKDILPTIREAIPDIKFLIVGSNPPEEIKRLHNDFITVTGYVPSTAPYLWQSYISVAPLRYGAGMKGKVGEAMAHGLPVVATTTGAQGMGLVDREDVMIADSPENFARAVIELIQNETLYAKIQKNAIDHVKANYTEIQVGKRIQNILTELRGMPVRKMSLSDKATFFFNYVLTLVSKKLKRLYYDKF